MNLCVQYGVQAASVIQEAASASRMERSVDHVLDTKGLNCPPADPQGQEAAVPGPGGRAAAGVVDGSGLARARPDNENPPSPIEGPNGLGALAT